MMVRHHGVRRLLLALLIALLSPGCGSSPTDSGGNKPPGDIGGGGGDLDQAGAWMWANPTPQGDPVLRLRFASAATAYAVTEGGAVLRSIDAGQSWEVAYKAIALQVAPRGGLFGLHFVSEERGWVVGTQGQITHTNDGGHSWSDQSIATIRTLRAVGFTGSNTGVVAGDNGTLYRTSDGGAAWMPVTHPAGVTDLNAVAFAGGTGWIGGDDGTILRSDDGGATWVQVATTFSHDIVVADPMAGGLAVFGTREGATIAMRSPTAWRALNGGDAVLDVDFDDEDNGRVLFYSNNTSYIGTYTGGVWSEQALSVPQIAYTLAANGGNMALAGARGYMAHSSNGGMSWQSVSGLAGNADPYTTQFWDVCFGDVDNGVTVGSGGAILYTTDGGMTWSPANSGTTEDILDVWLHSSGRGYAVGEGNVALRTTDGGATWAPMAVGVVVSRLRGVSMWDEMNAMLVGDGTTTQETILVTGDGGDTWDNQGETVLPIFVSTSVWVRPNGLAYVGQRDGIVKKTTDGGDNWTEYDTGTVHGIHHLQFVSDTHGWAAVEQHDMVFTKDGGLTWTRIGPGTLPGSVTQVHFVDENVGIAVGTTGNLFRSDDGGASWFSLSGGLTGQSHLRAIWMTSATDGVIVGTESKILYTRSAGLAPE